jgi:hypothetical protein
MAGGNVVVEAKLKGDVISFPVKASAIIYRGSGVAVDSTGYAVPCADTSGHKFVGIAEEKIDATGVDSGVLYIRVRHKGILKLKMNSGAAAITDVGKLVYAKTAGGASADFDVDLAGNCSNDVAIGLVTKNVDATYNWVDITPAPWGDIDLTAHIAKADQTAHKANGIGPTVTTENGAEPTITSGEFIGGLINCTYAGAVAFTLPTSGPEAGTQCRVVKAHTTAGLLTITGGTLVGPQCAGNVFIGCPNDGDSVVIECVAANSYRVVSVTQQIATTTYSGASDAITAAAFVGGKVACSYAGVSAHALPASGVPIGAKCTIVKTGSAGLNEITATALVGPGTATNATNTNDAQYDSVEIQCTGDDAYIVLSKNIA